MAGYNDRISFGRQVYDFFRSKGLPDHQAAAIAGNMAWEGGGRSDLVNPGDNLRNSPNAPHSIGIAQWNDRSQGLVDYARSKGIDIPAGDMRDVNYVRSIMPKLDLQTQLEYAWNEMQGPEARALKATQAGTDVPSAVAGAIGYHRPAGFTWANPSAGHGYADRVALAQNILRTGSPEATPPAGVAYDMYGEDARKPPNSTAQPVSVATAPMGPPGRETPSTGENTGLLSTIQGLLGQQSPQDAEAGRNILSAVLGEDEKKAQQAEQPFSLIPGGIQGRRQQFAFNSAPTVLGLTRRA